MRTLLVRLQTAGAGQNPLSKAFMVDDELN